MQGYDFPSENNETIKLVKKEIISIINLALTQRLQINVSTLSDEITFCFLQRFGRKYVQIYKQLAQHIKTQESQLRELQTRPIDTKQVVPQRQAQNKGDPRMQRQPFLTDPDDFIVVNTFNKGGHIQETQAASNLPANYPQRKKAQPRASDASIETTKGNIPNFNRILPDDINGPFRYKSEEKNYRIPELAKQQDESKSKYEDRDTSCFIVAAEKGRANDVRGTISKIRRPPGMEQNGMPQYLYKVRQRQNRRYYETEIQNGWIVPR